MRKTATKGPSAKSEATEVVRCAVYTRKSTEEGLGQEFNSLDAQREAAEAFVKSQAGEGWVLLPDRYDDGGFTGGNTDRPALQRLLADIAACKIDVVVVYKVDRLSRSLLDFAGMMQAFEKHGVSFVSVTQQFNTATSMGRLVLNVLLSFAQFEREIISERTRDKIAATRRKGKWAGGHPILGYDIDPQGFRLVVNPAEAEKVRSIFSLYLQHGSLLPVVRELDHRGWRNKLWTTRKGHDRGGEPFTRTSLYQLLTNVAFIGKVSYKDEVHTGEHSAVVEARLFQQTQDTLRRNGRAGGGPVRNQFGSLLKGLLHCGPCDCAMTPTHTAKNGNRRYRYYVCCNAQKRGRGGCPSKSVPAGTIEAFVVDRIRCIGRDPHLLREVIAQARTKDKARIAELEGERQILERDLKAWHRDVQRLSIQFRPGEENGELVGRLAELHERIEQAEAKARRLREETQSASRELISEDEAARTLAAFDPVWAALTPREQRRLIELLVERVEYDGARSRVSVSFRPTGIRILADELDREKNEQPREKRA